MAPVKLTSLPSEDAAPRYLSLARALIQNSDNPPVGAVESDGVMILIEPQFHCDSLP